MHMRCDFSVLIWKKLHVHCILNVWRQRASAKSYLAFQQCKPRIGNTKDCTTKYLARRLLIEPHVFACRICWAWQFQRFWVVVVLLENLQTTQEMEMCGPKPSFTVSKSPSLFLQKEHQTAKQAQEESHPKRHKYAPRLMCKCTVLPASTCMPYLLVSICLASH